MICPACRKRGVACPIIRERAKVIKGLHDLYLSTRERGDKKFRRRRKGKLT
jgi:23S rRNA A1618 N6-methylase RlmF